MTDIASFSSNRKFYDDARFPYGIDRSGEFTRQHANLLLNHGWAYLALAEGSRAPATPEEKAFVLVCHGEREAVTEHQVVWQLYSAKISAPKSSVSSPHIGSQSLAGNDPGINIDHDFKS